MLPCAGEAEGENAVPIRLPEPRWPSELVEEGPPEDPSIVLGGAAEIGKAPHRVMAVRFNPSTWRSITGTIWRRMSTPIISLRAGSTN